MSKIKNSGLDQYGAEPFEQQQFGTAGVKRVNTGMGCCFLMSESRICPATQANLGLIIFFIEY